MSCSIGVIGDFDPAIPSHPPTNDAIAHAATRLGSEVDVRWVPTDSLSDESAAETLAPFDGLWAAPGSPYRSLSGALAGIRFARERLIPFVGT